MEVMEVVGEGGGIVGVNAAEGELTTLSRALKMNISRENERGGRERGRWHTQVTKGTLGELSRVYPKSKPNFCIHHGVP